MPSYRAAKDLRPGDQVIAAVGPRRTTEPATVLAAIESVQHIPRKIVTVTLRSASGQVVHRTYGQLRTLELVKGD
jgi:predicted CoA-binding protein